MSIALNEFYDAIWTGFDTLRDRTPRTDTLTVVGLDDHRQTLIVDDLPVADPVYYPYCAVQLDLPRRIAIVRSVDVNRQRVTLDEPLPSTWADPTTVTLTNSPLAGCFYTLGGPGQADGYYISVAGTRIRSKPFGIGTPYEDTVLGTVAVVSHFPTPSASPGYDAAFWSFAQLYAQVSTLLRYGVRTNGCWMVQQPQTDIMSYSRGQGKWAYRAEISVATDVPAGG